MMTHRLLTVALERCDLDCNPRSARDPEYCRALGENIHLMRGWVKERTITSGGKYWDATTLGRRFATDIFQLRAPGLRPGG